MAITFWLLCDLRYVHNCPLIFDMKQVIRLWLFSLTLAGCGSNSQATYEPIVVVEEKQIVHYIFDDKFDTQEQKKLEDWICFTTNCAQKVLGEYPFDLYYHFHRDDSAARAVTFGHTRRTDTTQAAHFYVNPAFSLDELKADWIAPHEISHLAIPSLPKTNLWFYEGFATYMSRQVMIEMGVLSKQEVDSINNTRVGLYINEFETSSLLPFVADSLIKQHQYPAVYWIGASFFMEADDLLAEEAKQPLVDILKEFQTCCHVTKMTIDELIESFDEISGSTIFGTLYSKYTTEPANTLLSDFK